jgi:hypothetical protein
MPAKQCRRCGKKPVRKGYRFCDDCIAEVRAEMEEAHYLTPRPPRTRRRREDEYNEDFQDDGDDFALVLLRAWLGC